jgi:hypothetical protein
MDESTFDALTRSFAVPSRRAVFSALGAALFPALFDRDEAEDALAKPKRGNRRRDADAVQASGKSKKKGKGKKKKKKKGGGGNASPPDAANVVTCPANDVQRPCDITGECCPWTRICCGPTCCGTGQECIANRCVDRCDEGQTRCNGAGQCCDLGAGNMCAGDDCCDISFETPHQGVCCVFLNGFACGAIADGRPCCPGLDCVGNQCCIPQGVSGCRVDQDCCHGNQCLDGWCVEDCRIRDWCSVDQTCCQATGDCLWDNKTNCRLWNGVIGGCPPPFNRCCVDNAGRTDSCKGDTLECSAPETEQTPVTCPD